VGINIKEDKESTATDVINTRTEPQLVECIFGWER